MVSVLCIGDWGWTGAGISSACWVTTVAVLLAALPCFLSGSALPVKGGKEVVSEWGHADEGVSLLGRARQDLHLLVLDTLQSSSSPSQALFLPATYCGGLWYLHLPYHPVAT